MQPLSFRIVYQNIKGLGRKLRDLHIDTAGLGYQVVAFAEMWLNRNVFNA